MSEQIQDDASVATAAAPAEEKIAYTVANDSMRPQCQRALVLDLPIAPFDKRMKEVFRDFQKNATLPGFRRGKAPEGLLRRRFGKEMEREAVQHIAGKVFDQVRVDLNIPIIGEPSLEDYHLEAGQKLTIDVLMEVLPAVEPKEYKGHAIEVAWKEPEAVSFDKYTNNLAERWATIEDVDDVIDMDQPAVLTVVVADDKGQDAHGAGAQEQPYPKVSDLPEPVAAALVGKRAGDTVTASNDHEHGHGDHKHVHHETWTVTVNKVQRRHNANVDDNFFKENFGLEGGIDEFRKKFEDRKSAEAAEMKRDAELDAIFEHLLKHNQFDVPRTLVSRQVNTLAARDKQRFDSYGVDIQRVIRTNKQYRDNLLGNAETGVKIALLTRAIIDAEKLEATDADVDAEIQRRADIAGRKPLAIRAQLERAGTFDGLKEELLSKKAYDFLVAGNNLSYVEPKAEEGHGHEGHNH